MVIKIQYSPQQGYQREPEYVEHTSMEKAQRECATILQWGIDIASCEILEKRDEH